MATQPEPEERLFAPGLDVIFLPKLLVDLHSLALLFSVDGSTIRRWSRAGHMPKPRKVGGRVLWSGDELREWIAAGCPEVPQ